jgi:uncharacterized protein involved in exopolysaccharide biosynthesis
MAYDLDNVEAAPQNSPFIPVLQIVVDMADLLLRRWWIVLLATIIGAGIAYQISSKLPDQYVAAAKMIVDEPSVPQPGAGENPDILADRRMSLQRRPSARSRWRTPCTAS